MKKIFIAFAALSLMIGCTKEIEQKSEHTVERDFTASFDEPSKTSLDASGKVDWCKDDVISYYTASDGAISSVTVPEDSHSFTFTATVGVDDSFIIAAYGGTISAPQGKSMTLTSNAAGAEQSGKFEDAHVSVCKRYFENGNTLSFKCITSLIKFSLARTDIAYVTFTANDGTKIHGNGKIYFTFSGETISATFGQDEGGSAIKVNTGGAGTFFIASLPCSINGFTLKYFDNSNKLIGSTTAMKTLSLGSKKIVDLGTLDSRIGDVPPVDLSAQGTANCYIASESGVNYRFKATVKGGSTESVGSVKKAKVLWESFGTDVTPSVGDVVSNVSMDGDYVKFTSGLNGNAVIVVKDIDDDILWSWHIWVCDGYDPDATAQVYNNNAGTMMDRNLGATSATPGDVHALGLLYQWGRKDPFLGSSSISKSIVAKSTYSWPSVVKSNSSNGTIFYAVSHPTTYISGNDNNYDWYYTGSSSTDNTRWQTSDNKKGMYDPCPTGWRVPDGGNSGVWSNAHGSSKYYYWKYDLTNRGGNFSGDLGVSTNIWYPAAGGIYDGTFQDVGNEGMYCTCTPYSESFRAYATIMYLMSYDVHPDLAPIHSMASSVRCVKEGTQPQTRDLSVNGTANCYIVSEAGKYKIKAVQGNTATPVGDVKAVKVLWESYGTDVTPTVGDIIKSDVSYSDGYITFSTNSTFTEGNAVIAAYSDAACTNGNVLWSWHIWCTDKPEEQVYNNNAGTMMDRNLGATSSSKTSVGCFGLLYQWGRKDPFTGPSSFTGDAIATATNTFVSSGNNSGTIEMSIKNPMNFLCSRGGFGEDWLYYGNNSLWGNTKTIYDPCPAGYRVPDGGSLGIWAKSCNTSQSYLIIDGFASANYKGIEGLFCQSSCWYPAVGVRNPCSGRLHSLGYYHWTYTDAESITTGKYGKYWSCTPITEDDNIAYCLGFNDYSRVDLYDAADRAAGLPIRCLKDNN